MIEEQDSTVNSPQDAARAQAEEGLRRAQEITPTRPKVDTAEARLVFQGWLGV